MNRKDCLKFIRSVNDKEKIQSLLVEVVKAGDINKRGTWSQHANKLLKWIDGGLVDPAPFTIFRPNGNKKLPFYAFSSLPFADCPGKGECVKYCYSLKAWRYPAAFFRQLQNSLLMRNNKQMIAQAWQAIPQARTVRLFVDGDFPNVDLLRFFMDLCKARQDLSIYGYSKSWQEFVSLNASGYKWPSNYLVNQSNGSRWINTGIGNAFLQLPVVRGAFDAVPVDKSFIKSRAYQDKANPGSDLYRKAVKEKLKAMHKRVFACPGNCGNCLPQGKHACGSKSFDGVAIGIGIHA